MQKVIFFWESCKVSRFAL